MRSAPANEILEHRLQKDDPQKNPLERLHPQEVRRQLDDGKAALVAGYHFLMASRGSAELEQLRWAASWDNAELWHSDGSKSTGEWIATHFGISRWKANRMIAAGHALPALPLITAALAGGGLSLDKVVELTRFATPETERKLISWAQRVTPAGIRDRADKLATKKTEEVRSAVQTRSFRKWSIDEERVGFEGELPSDQGAILFAAVDRLAGTMPDLPPDDEMTPQQPAELTIDQRRADALVALASTQIANDQNPDLATVVVNAPLQALVSGEGNAEIDLGHAIHFETARRLACDCRLEVAMIDGNGNTVGIGRASRNVPRWLRRQLMRRDDHTCQFPGCGARRFLHAHHIWHWTLGGPTNLDNVLPLCPTHHRLVHEFGWGVTRSKLGEVSWYRPSGRAFEPGPLSSSVDEYLDNLPPPDPPRLIEVNRYSKWIALAASL